MAQQKRKTGSPVSSQREVKTGLRFIALECLLAWQESPERPLEFFLETTLTRFRVADPRDQGLVKAMVYGVVRWRNFLDAVLEKFSRHPLDKMRPATLAALRLGVYQLVFLDRVPAAAAINETVETLKKKKQPPWLAGFVNGLLRTIDRQRTELPDPQAAETALASHPGWLVARWRDFYGPARAAAICRANNEMPPLVLRVNRRRATVTALCAAIAAAGYRVEQGLFSEEAVRLPGFQGQVVDIPGFREGYFQVQDEAAQLATLLLGPFGPGAYLDGCAGLGGKTTYLAELLPDGAEITAVEPDRRRQGLLAENLSRLGLAEKVRSWTTTLEEFCQGETQRFRAILIDAPCSGLGVIRRHPEIRWLRSALDLENNQQKQLALLEVAAPLLKPGGVMVYATCSTEPEENQAVVGRFLALHPEFTLSGAKEFLPPGAACLVDQEGFFRTTPDQGLDGFFAARLVKSHHTDYIKKEKNNS